LVDGPAAEGSLEVIARNAPEYRSNSLDRWEKWYARSFPGFALPKE